MEKEEKQPNMQWTGKGEPPAYYNLGRGKRLKVEMTESAPGDAGESGKGATRGYAEDPAAVQQLSGGLWKPLTKKELARLSEETGKTAPAAENKTGEIKTAGKNKNSKNKKSEVNK